MKKKINLTIILSLVMVAVFAFTGCSLLSGGLSAEQQAQLDKITAMEEQLATLLADNENSNSDKVDELETLIGDLRDMLADAGVDTTSDVIAEVADSVVAIQVEWYTSRGVYSGVATGTGFYIAQGGYLATNSHVITPDSGYVLGDINITMYDGTETTAEIVADLADIDVAILKSDVALVNAATIVDYYSDTSKLPARGNRVIAIGTPIDIDLKFSCTSGIVSGLDRLGYTDTSTYHSNAIQHDAAINPGNSGGPLFNMAGHVIGINTFGMLDYESLGFATDISFVYQIQQGIKRSVLNGNSYELPALNITVTDSTLDLMKSSSYSYTVYTGSNVKIISRSTGADSSLTAGKIITAIDGKEINSRQDYYNAILSKDSGDTVTLTLKASSASTITSNITVTV